jgi:hypothetical protein
MRVLYSHCLLKLGWINTCCICYVSPVTIAFRKGRLLPPKTVGAEILRLDAGTINVYLKCYVSSNCTLTGLQTGHTFGAAYMILRSLPASDIYRKRVSTLASLVT